MTDLSETPTPRTDAADTYPNDYHKMWCHAEQLERELQAANARVEELEREVGRWKSWQATVAIAEERDIALTQLSEAKAELESVKRSALMGMAAAQRIGSVSLAEAQRIQATLKPETLESEREMNRILTEELEEAKAEIATLPGCMCQYNHEQVWYRGDEAKGLNLACPVCEAKAEVERLRIACRGGNAINDTATMLRFFAARLTEVYGESPNTDYIRCAEERAKMLDAVKDGRAVTGGSVEEGRPHGILEAFIESNPDRVKGLFGVKVPASEDRDSSSQSVDYNLGPLPKIDRTKELLESDAKKTAYIHELIAKLNEERDMNKSEYLRGFRDAREMAAKVAWGHTLHRGGISRELANEITDICGDIRAIEPGE